MAHQVLARKYRPRTFQEMVGQESILRILSNALEQKRLHHAYLFTGTRGVGKTTIGRILAKCLNCETGVTATPCQTCSACKAIDAGQFLDLYEVDAASRTKVEDTRELLDNVMYPPTQGRYKVYLIDEVHMLSNNSFNALLKTLEEPPEHVKFLLATTDPKKLPVTILSRCLQFYLRHITPELIAGHLKHVCDAEQIQCETAALEQLARAANGSMRDALSLLDQASAYSQGNVNAGDVKAMLGTMAQDDLLPLLDALATQDGKELFTLIEKIAEHVPDFQQALEELIILFHRIAVAQIVPSTAQNDAHITRLAKKFSAEDIQLYYQIALLGRRDLAFAPNPQQGFEMTMLRMLAFKPATGMVAEAPQPIASEKKAAAPAKVAAIASSEIVEGLSEWRDILPKLELNGMAYALASNCTLEAITETKVKLALSVSHQPMLNDKLKERIAESLSRYLKKTVQLEINVTTTELATPQKQNQQEQATKLSGAKQSALDNPKLKELIEMYDATVEVALL